MGCDWSFTPFFESQNIPRCMRHIFSAVTTGSFLPKRCRKNIIVEFFFKNFPGLLFGLSAWERPGQVFQGEDVSNEAHPLQTNLLTTKSFGRHEVIGRSRRPITAFLETSLGS